MLTAWVPCGQRIFLRGAVPRAHRGAAPARARGRRAARAGEKFTASF
ncbi:hypothetical protein L533_1052 [Bordetella bronchiseptica OSU553]|nr:hypothetical protein L533_1052 [Bordetella bronchiseptica OSU553]